MLRLTTDFIFHFSDKSVQKVGRWSAKQTESEAYQTFIDYGLGMTEYQRCFLLLELGMTHYQRCFLLLELGMIHYQRCFLLLELAAARFWLSPKKRQHETRTRAVPTQQEDLRRPLRHVRAQVDLRRSLEYVHTR